MGIKKVETYSFLKDEARKKPISELDVVILH